MYASVDNAQARPATSSVISRKEDRERGCGTCARGHHLLRKRAEREAAHADDPEIRRSEDNRHRKRPWTCCICSLEFVNGDESEDIHFCSFHDCQHVMCAEQAHTVGIRNVKVPGQKDLVFAHYFCWHHKESDLCE
eukprot:5066980-Amphidinium_carterae.3